MRHDRIILYVFLCTFSRYTHVLILNVHKINCETQVWNFVRFVFLILSSDYLRKPKCEYNSRIFIVNTVFNACLFVIKRNRHVVYYTITNCTYKFGPDCIQCILHTFTYVSIYIRSTKRHTGRIHGCNEINAYKLVWNTGR